MGQRSFVVMVKSPGTSDHGCSLLAAPCSSVNKVLEGCMEGYV